MKLSFLILLSLVSSIAFSDESKSLTDSKVKALSGLEAKDGSVPGNGQLGMTEQFEGSTLFYLIPTGNKRKNYIKLQIGCELEGSRISTVIPFRFKEVDWKLKEVEGKDLTGQATTGADGEFLIVIPTSTTIESKTLELQIAGTLKTVNLKHGPFNLVIPESICKNKKVGH